MEEALVDSVKNTPPIRGRKERNSSIELFRILAALRGCKLNCVSKE